MTARENVTQCDTEKVPVITNASAYIAYQRLLKDRDAARAEVKRLRAILARTGRYPREQYK